MSSFSSSFMLKSPYSRYGEELSKSPVSSFFGTAGADWATPSAGGTPWARQRGAGSKSEKHAERSAKAKKCLEVKVHAGIQEAHSKRFQNKRTGSGAQRFCTHARLETDPDMVHSGNEELGSQAPKEFGTLPLVRNHVAGSPEKVEVCITLGVHGLHVFRCEYATATGSRIKARDHLDHGSGSDSVFDADSGCSIRLRGVGELGIVSDADTAEEFFCRNRVCKESPQKKKKQTGFPERRVHWS